jgi:hypothetical protein
MDTKPQGQAEGPALEGRNGAVWRAYAIYRKTQEAIAQEFGISQPRVSQIIKEVRDKIEPDSRTDMRLQAAEVYNELQKRALAIADMRAAPVFVGKDGDVARDPEADNAVVRDYAAQVKALELAGKFQAETRKLYGLDDPTKVQSDQTVRYVLEGVNTDDLT